MQPRITFDTQLKMALVQVLLENQNFLETKQFSADQEQQSVEKAYRNRFLTQSNTL